MSSIAVSDFVRPATDDPYRAYFRVVAITSNGWAHCTCVCYHDGRRTRDLFPREGVFLKRRLSALSRVDALPPEPEKEGGA